MWSRKKNFGDGEKTLVGCYIPGGEGNMENIFNQLIKHTMYKLANYHTT